MSKLKDALARLELPELVYENVYLNKDRVDEQFDVQIGAISEAAVSDSREFSAGLKALLFELSGKHGKTHAVKWDLTGHVVRAVLLQAEMTRNDRIGTPDAPKDYVVARGYGCLRGPRFAERIVGTD